MTLQHVILCEGYDDRAFWTGWLLHMGLQNLAARPGSSRVKRVIDPWGRPVVDGQYGFFTASGAFVRLVPCRGGNKVAPAAAQFLTDHATHPIGRLLINLDADDTTQAASSSARDAIAGIVRTHVSNPGGGAPDGTGAYRVDEVTICPIIWECRDADAPGIPAKQTLERLVAASLVAADPRRGENVATWLAAAPRGGDSHKHHALSYLAKWYADHGPDDFFKELWRDPSTATQLQHRLRETGAWAHVEALARA